MTRFASAVFTARRFLERLGLNGLRPQPRALISAMLPRVALATATCAICSPWPATAGATPDVDHRAAAAFVLMALWPVPATGFPEHCPADTLIRCSAGPRRPTRTRSNATSARCRTEG